MALERRFLLALLLISILAASAAFANNKGNVKDLVVEIPKPPFEAKFMPGLITYPKLATPAFLKPGDSFTVVFSRNPGTVNKIIVDDGYGHKYSLEYRQEGTRVAAKLPANAAKGVYDLIVVVGDKAYGEPHAVIIASPETYKTVYLVHVTDRHFGVINSNGRPAANYDLAVDTIALGMPNNTIVVDTGDVADTARDVEYTESIWTDYILNKPLIGIPGNHDHVGNSPNYAKYRGEWNYTLSIYNLYRVVAIDSGGDGYITDAQAEWAASVLETTKEPVKIVMFHHPHFTHVWGKTPHVFKANSPEDLYKILTSKKPGSKYMYIYSSWLQNKKALKTLVKGMYNAPCKREVVFSGHVHLDSYAEVHRADGSVINYIVTTATGGSVRPGDYHGFRVVKLTSTGSIEIMGDGPYDARHASFNTENVEVGVVDGPAAVASYFAIAGTNATKLMERTVIALPIPKEYYGKKLHLYLVNLDNYRIRCTPLGCVLYAYTTSPPKEGILYKAVLYTKPDKATPSLKLLRVYPPKPLAGRQVVLSFSLSDDAWGIEKVEAKLYYDGKEIKLTPSIIGNTMRIIIPPLPKSIEKAKIEVVVADVSGKETRLSRTITYLKPRPATTTTATTTETQTQAQPATKTEEKTTTFTSTTSSTTSTTTTTTTQERTTTAQSPAQTVATAIAESGNATIIVAIVILAALAAFLALVMRR